MSHVLPVVPVNDKSTTSTTNYNTIEKWLFVCIVIPIYISIRCIMINKMPLMDCDEVYNYWEPLHYMLYNSGLQTWEYSYEYALRTYTYLMPLYLISNYCYIPLISNVSTRHYLYLLSQEILSVNKYPASTDKVLLFYLLRCTISIGTAICELIWLYTLLLYYQKQKQKQNKNQQQLNNKEGTNSSFLLLLSNYCTSTSTVWYTIIVLLCSAGMNHCSGAFLPSTTWISIWCLCCTCYLQKNDYLFAFIAILATLSIGWPFGCVCVLPMSFHILYRQYYSTTSTGNATSTNKKTSLQQHGSFMKLFYFIVYIIVVSIIIQYYIVMKIDEYYYGDRTIIPTLNIIKYNAGGNGDTLYGVEPISYYIKNLLLNFNILFLFGTITIPLLLVFYVLDYYTIKKAETTTAVTTSPSTNTTDTKSTTTTTTNTTNSNTLIFNIEQFIILLSLPIWFLITFPRPHKEERFMYPIYPILVYGGVQSIQLIVQYYMIQQQKEYQEQLQAAIASMAIATATAATATDTTLPTKKKKRKSCSIVRFFYRNIKYLLLLHEQIIPILLIVFCCIISILRTGALSKYYTGPLIVYNRLAFQPVPDIQAVIEKTFYAYPSIPESFKPELVQDNVCVCGEWYRFPSSFFLPNNTQLGFLPSSFTGQLPQPFTKYGSTKESLQYLQPFNDRNQHEESRYVNINSYRNDCKWYVVLHSESESTLCGWPQLYGKARVDAVDFLDNEQTKSTLHRTLYIPYNNYHKQAMWDDEINFDTYIVYAEFDNYPIIRLKKYSWISNSTERELLQKENKRKYPNDEF